MFYKYFINELAFVIPKLDVTVTEWNLARNKAGHIEKRSLKVLCNFLIATAKSFKQIYVCGVYILKQSNMSLTMLGYVNDEVLSTVLLFY